MPDALLFTIDATRYAIPLRDVAEIVSAVKVQVLPDAPAIVEGVVNVRGTIVPVLSLRARLGHPPRSPDVTEFFILVNARSRRVIVRSDTSPEIVNLPDIQPGGEEEVDRALAGVLPLLNGIAMFQDIDRFMASDDELSLNAALAAGAQA
ncbi:MAG: chemotaxis protein CheW [Gemmatimonadota bacterium]|nr:chemotaxis protein CheW [Gemmatimonadota bacterium]